MPIPLGRAAAARAGEPLPPLPPVLARSRFQLAFERGQLVMLAGPPSGGKTALAIILALFMQVPTLYVAADSDEMVMASRVGAAMTGHDLASVRQAIEHGLWQEMYGDQLADTPIRFLFDPSEPSLQDLTNALACWLDVWGDYPHLIIIDNLLNLANDDASEWAGLRKLMKNLHWLARKSKACVLVLHHTGEGDDRKTGAPPRSAIQGKVSQLPALILTMADDEVAVVKNRSGRTDRHASAPLMVAIDFTTMRLVDRLEGSVMA